MEKIRVIIADDSDFVRDGMRIILDVDEEFEVLGVASTGKEAIQLAEKQAPDVFLMDIQMPEMDGIEATKIIVERGLGKVLILTTFDDDELVRRALQNGAKGYLIKNHTPEHLKQMIRSVYFGSGVMDENVLVTILVETLYLIIKVSAPMLIVSLVVGLVISILQTVTSIQEQTLTFVPKLLSIFLVLMIAGNWIMTNIREYFQFLCDNFTEYIR